MNKKRVHEEKIAAHQEEKEEKEMQGVTFHPKIYTKEEDIDKLRDESFYEGVPTGFKVIHYIFSRRLLSLTNVVFC